MGYKVWLPPQAPGPSPQSRSPRIIIQATLPTPSSRALE